MRDLDELVEQIVRARPGTNFYNPLGSKNRALIDEMGKK
jgi:hypothetical protein